MKEDHGRPSKQQEGKRREFNNDDTEDNSHNNTAGSEKMGENILWALGYMNWGSAEKL